MDQVFEVNAETGEAIYRDPTAEEIAQNKKDLKEKQLNAEQELAKKEQALSKLSALGLELEDLKVLGVA